MTSSLIGLLQAASSGSPQGGAGGLLSSPMLPMLAILGVMYFVVLLPQSRKKQKAQQEMLSNLKKGDDVVTQGGILGKISGVKDDEVTLQVQEGVRIRVLKSAITSVNKAPSGEPAKSEAKADAKSEAKGTS